MLRIYRNDRNQIFLHRHILTRYLVSTTKNLYEVLGVHPSATKADIKKAYIEKAKQCHPDLFPDDEEKTKEFQNLQEAYSILSDTKTRAEYAQMTQQRVQQNNPEHGSSYRHPYSDHNLPRHNPYGSRFGGTGKSDPFHEMMQEMMRQQNRYRAYGQETNKEAKAKGVRWDKIITRFAFIYIVALIFFAHFRLRLRAANENAPAPDLEEQMMNARMAGSMSPRERQMLAQRREVQELMEQYYTKNSKQNDTDKSDEPL